MDLHYFRDKVMSKDKSQLQTANPQSNRTVNYILAQSTDDPLLISAVTIVDNYSTINLRWSTWHSLYKDED
jgi:hypothetical protein